jgi:hypothetical protein
MFRSIRADKFSPPLSPFNPGPAPILDWLKIGALVVDPTYQRNIGRRGTINIKSIAENFDWSKFAPVIVAPLEGGKFAVVDGQHRTTSSTTKTVKATPSSGPAAVNPTATEPLLH